MALAILLAFSMALSAQDRQHVDFRYISPVPGSKFIMPGNNIALRHGDKLDKSCLQHFHFHVEGSISGTIPGQTVLSDDHRTIIFLPDHPYALGETVHVTTSGEVTTTEGLGLNGVEFTFNITAKVVELPKDYMLGESFRDHQLNFIKHHSKYTPLNKQAKDNNLPEDFPELTVEVMNESFDNGYYFVSPFGYWGWFPDNTPYIIAFDDHATPVFYRRIYQHGYDFKWNPNGKLTFFYNEWPEAYYRILDASYNIIDTVAMRNGYFTDFHEFFMLENDHCFITAYDTQLFDMSEIVEGGQENAFVTGWVFQELDANKNVVFQWRSWDHYDILDAEGYVDLTATSIDVVHGNAIEIAPDNNLLLSPRNLNEITKVDRNTGEIIWRLNGKNNMFEFINDDGFLFSGQHDCRILSNGNLSIFDNGTYIPAPEFSSMVEYAIDEENYTATMVRRLRNDPDIFGSIMGSARELPNGNIVAGWGSGVPGVTEFDGEGNVASTYYFAGINYRVYRYPFTTDYFTVNTDELNYGYIWMEGQLTKTVEVTNNQDEEIVLTSHHLRGNNFTVENEFPIAIPAGGQVTLQVTFTPGQEGSFTDVLTLNHDINEDPLIQRIAQQVKLIGHATLGQGIGDGLISGVTLSPNPVEERFELSFENEQEAIHVAIFDATGKQVLKESHFKVSTFQCDIGTFDHGFYFVELRNAGMEQIGMLKIIKK
jgi:hypothetical protein